ncbi:hypothetical protein ROHU_021596 [Labeo rohita]|uniref:Uncharacterized protein n=1 Tax=Labeo rohita TaxID=84645 RepID=A0A498MXL8_LABRO|nr:hypothetical protein ROHU_021596 [Labeo rohita]
MSLGESPDIISPKNRPCEPLPFSLVKIFHSNGCAPELERISCRRTSLDIMNHMTKMSAIGSSPEDPVIQILLIG